MNNLLKAINAEEVTTENGCKSFASTLNKNLDFYGNAGASRGKDITGLFSAAFAEDSDLATRNLLYLRDVRQGLGERDLTRSLIKNLIDYADYETVVGVINKIPELGRFDDLKEFFGTKYEKVAVQVWVREIQAFNMLAAKWAPVKDKKGAKPLRKALGLSEGDWRKHIVPLRTTLEQIMCAKRWEDIDYSKLPSQALRKHTKAFDRNDHDKFQAYLNALSKGEAKVNAGALYPYDVLHSLKKGDTKLANAQWDALPDFMEGSEENILPIVDTSASMTWPQAKLSDKIYALDVALSLGLYTSERSKGIFKDAFMTFNCSPEMRVVKGTLQQRYQQMKMAPVGGSTNIEAAFDLILRSAVIHNVPQEDMPTKLLIVSDMQFNRCVATNGNYVGGVSVTAMESIRQKYSNAGYKLPQIVFWQVNAREGATPITTDNAGTALVSGFSPAILKSVLGKDLDPVKIMVDCLNQERYNYKG